MGLVLISHRTSVQPITPRTIPTRIALFPNVWPMTPARCSFAFDKQTLAPCKWEAWRQDPRNSKSRTCGRQPTKTRELPRSLCPMYEFLPGQNVTAPPQLFAGDIEEHQENHIIDDNP